MVTSGCPDADYADNHEQATPVAFQKDQKFVATLGDISSNILMLPASTGSLQGLEKHGEIAVASGGTTDIWRGVWDNKPVALKAFRIYPPQDLLDAKKILWKFAPTWKRLIHENVLPFHGVDTSLFHLALVYEWGRNGNIMQYLESNPGASRTKLVIEFPRFNCTVFLTSTLSCCKLLRDFSTSILSMSSMVV